MFLIKNFIIIEENCTAIFFRLRGLEVAGLREGHGDVSPVPLSAGQEKRPRVPPRVLPMYCDASFFYFYPMICLFAFFYDKLAVFKICSSYNQIYALSFGILN